MTSPVPQASEPCTSTTRVAFAPTEPLHDSQSLLLAIINGTPDGIYAKDLEGRYVVVNEAGARLVGKTADAMRGQHFATILDPLDADQVAREDQAALTTGQGQLIETSGIYAGEQHWFQTLKTPYHDARGKIQGIVGISRDITELKRAEAALQQSEAEYRAMFELAGVGNAQIDYRTGHILRANRRLCEMLGFTAAELMALTLVDVTHPADRETNIELFERRQRKEIDGYSLEKRFLRRDGTLLWGEIHTALIQDRAGAPLYVIATVQDITARKQADEERAELFAAEQQARAAAETERQRATFLAAVSATLSTSLDYAATLRTIAHLAIPNFASWCSVDLIADEQIQRVAYAAADDNTEQVLGELAKHYPIDARDMHPIAKAISDGKPMFAAVLPEDFAYRAGRDERHRALLKELPCRSGIIVPMTARGQRLGAISFASSQPGRYSAADLVLADQIAYRASLAIDNARLFRQSETAVRLRDQFLSIASHELKSPLTSLVGYAELLEKRVQLGAFDEREQRAIHIVAQQTARLEKLIDAILDVSRIETGQIAISREPIDLNEIAAEVSARMRLLLKRHVLELSAADEPLVMQGDAFRMQQVLENLIHNAIKYSPAGGPIRVTVECREQQAVLSVSDQGIGIPAAAQEHLFNRFYRAPNAETWGISGMGIGLFVVREIVRLHGGTVAVDSHEGVGTTFTVCLPLV